MSLFDDPPMPAWAREEHERHKRAMARRDGATFEHAADGKSFGAQHQAVFELMRDGKWRTLFEIEEALEFPQASISARLRDFRKPRFGAHEVSCRRRAGGTFEYSLTERTEG